MKTTNKTKAKKIIKETIKGYKVFNPDWTCRGFKFEVGKKYKIKDKPECCSVGFHFCEIASDCFNYYSFDSNNKVALVEAIGEISKHGDDSKIATNHISIIEEISWEKLLTIVNTGKGNSGYMNSGDMNSGDRNSGNMNSGYRNSGDMNSGYRNSGDMNSGYRNSGDRNSGDRNSGNMNSGYRNSGDMNSGDRNSGNMNSGDMNSGDRNSGNMNSGNRNSGYMNTTTPTVRLFDTQTEISFDECFNSEWYDILFNRYYFNLNKWISFDEMSEEEKIKYSKAYVCDGYLKTNTYHEAWNELWNKLTEEEKTIVKNMPYFNAEKFKIITGIQV